MAWNGPVLSNGPVIESSYFLILAVYLSVAFTHEVRASTSVPGTTFTVAVLLGKSTSTSVTPGTFLSSPRTADPHTAPQCMPSISRTIVSELPEGFAGVSAGGAGTSGVSSGVSG